MAEKTYPERYTEKVFKGKIELDVCDSIPDWTPYLAPKARKDAPNVLAVLFDDTGCRRGHPTGDGSTCRRRRSSPTAA